MENQPLKRVHENIIIIGDLSETHRRPKFLIGDPSETNMPDRRPIRDRHASSDSHRRPTFLIGDQPATVETHWRRTCLIGD